MRMIRRVPLIGLLAAVAFHSSYSRADDTPARVPADAIVYLQWKGADALGPIYQSSHMKALSDTFGFTGLLEKYIHLHTATETDPVALGEIQVVKDLIDAVSKSTTTLYVGPIDFANPDLPVPKLAIFSDVGKERAAALAPKIRSLLERQKNDTSPPFTSLQVGDYLVVSIGADVEVDKRLAGPIPTDGLASTAAFKSTIAQLGPHATDNANLLYINAETALKMGDDYVASRSSPTTSPWPMIEEAMGVTELNQIGVTGNFEGQNWVSQAFIGMGEKRAGLLRFLDNPAIEAAGYRLVPSDAAWAMMFHFDTGKLLEDLRNVAAQTGRQGARQFDSALQQFYAFTGVDLKTDVIDSMGNTYAMYQTPDADGKSCNGFTYAATLKNPQKMETALTTLESFTNAMIKQRDAGTAFQFKTEPLAAPNEKITAHFITLETFAPTWAISNGVLYISSSKAGVQSAIEKAGMSGPITENPAFKSLSKSLGQDAISSFSFIDFPKVGAEMEATAATVLAQHNAKHPDDLIDYQLPPAGAILPQLEPALRVSWADATGWHLKSVGPFPLSTYIGPQNFVLQYMIHQEQAQSAKPTPAAP